MSWNTDSVNRAGRNSTYRAELDLNEFSPLSLTI